MRFGKRGYTNIIKIHLLLGYLGHLFELAWYLLLVTLLR